MAITLRFFERLNTPESGSLAINDHNSVVGWTMSDNSKEDEGIFGDDNPFWREASLVAKWGATHRTWAGK